MNKRIIGIVLLTVLVGSWGALAMAIAPEQMDEQRVFWGDAAKFETPAEVDYKAVVVANTTS
jgi:hypothetical protein